MAAKPESNLTSQDLRDLYRELILDHARSPRHFGAMDSATHEARGVNQLCGDKLRLFIRVEDDRITDVRFEGTGCAISIASASLLAETLPGIAVDDAMTFSAQLMHRLANGDQEDGDFDPGSLRALEGVREYPSRVKCATLAWQTLRSAIERNEAPASTE